MASGRCGFPAAEASNGAGFDACWNVPASPVLDRSIGRGGHHLTRIPAIKERFGDAGGASRNACGTSPPVCRHVEVLCVVLRDERRNLVGDGQVGPFRDRRWATVAQKVGQALERVIGLRRTASFVIRRAAAAMFEHSNDFVSVMVDASARSPARPTRMGPSARSERPRGQRHAAYDRRAARAPLGQ